MKNATARAREIGDEFVVFVDGGDPSVVAERLRRAVQRSIFVDGHELVTTASIGIAVTRRAAAAGSSRRNSRSRPWVFWKTSCR
mgnify:CR=1 FL=1